MATPTYIPLATITLSTTDASITFSSIPATYRDLVLVLNGTGSTTLGALLRFNGDTGNNYFEVFAQGSGTTATSSAGSADRQQIATLLSGSRTTVVTQIMDYAQTNKHKSMLVREDNASNKTVMVAARWASTAAINSMQVYTSNGFYASGTTISLYGIAS
jgi:hypothetical protein